MRTAAIAEVFSFQELLKIEAIPHRSFSGGGTVLFGCRSSSLFKKNKA